MKKILTVLVALLMVFALAGCGSTDGGDDAAKDTIKVGVTIYTFDDNFMTLYRNNIQSYFDALEGYEVQIENADNDMAKQTEQVNTFISQGVDVLIVNLVQTSSGEVIADLCEEAGIPCVFINREIEGFSYPADQCYIGANAKDSGTFQGQIIYDLPEHGDLNGNGKLDYIMLMGDPENSDAKFRTEYSIKYLTDNGVEVNCLYQETGMWEQAKGQELTAAALSQYGKDIDVVFCNNDAMALGAAQAITAAGRVVGEDIYLVGVDALDECVEMVNAGTMTGTVLNDAVGQATAACEAAVAYATAAENNPYAGIVTYVPYVMVTK